MVTKEDLQAKYAGLSNSALLGILEHKGDYTELAVETVTEEIKRRNLTANDHQAYEEQKSEKVKINYENAIVDLLLWQKVISYIPVFGGIFRRAVRMNFNDDGSLLKSKQANYFTYTGYGALLLAVLAEVFLEADDLVLLAIFIICFVPIYLYNQNSYKPQQLAKINKMFGV